MCGVLVLLSCCPMHFTHIHCYFKWSASNNSLVQYLSLLTIIHANDVNLNPGPTHNDTVHDRDYLCGTCDRLVDWEDRGVKYETCDQWHHASCQSIHTLSYNQLEDTELNISWHCIICNNPNYSSTVHVYQTVDVSVDVTNDSSITFATTAQS